MTPAQARAVLAEMTRRAQPSPILASAFPRQRALLDDPARFKSVLCTRRAGKSYGIGIWLIDSAMQNPNTAYLYLGLTRDTVRRIMIDPVLKTINRKHSVGATFVDKPLEMRFPNGAVIYLLGVDATDDERDKILGQKFKRVAIDECGSMRYDLRVLVEKTVRPTLVDLKGELLLAGTPENTKNFFYEVTEGLDANESWSRHTWSAFDNPYIAAQWQEEIDGLIAKNPLIVDTPLYQQHYLGKWTVDASKLVYRYDRARNHVSRAPWGNDLSGVHVLAAIDLGYNDATAVVVSAYTDHDPTLYIVEAHKREKLTVSEVAAWLQGFMRKYTFEQMIVDPASKQVVEELRQRYRIPLESAEKSGKVQAIAMMNSDLLTGQIKIVGAACDAIEDEWAGLVWDERTLERTGQYVENSACANHCADAGLYGFRAARNYAPTSAPKKPAPGSEEEQEDWFAEEERRQAKAERVPFWERD